VHFARLLFVYIFIILACYKYVNRQTEIFLIIYGESRYGEQVAQWSAMGAVRIV
jgi:hypothetical protein